MADSPRNTQISRRSWLLAGLAAPLFRLRGAETIAVTFDGDNLHVTAPAFHFLTGKPLTRLKNGSTVVFLTQLTIFSDPFVTVLKRAPVERFVVSYDIWSEDRFSVTIPGVRTAGNLTAQATEQWCMENLAIKASGLGPDRQFWIQLEMRTAEPRELSNVVSGPGISLGNLISLLSRKPGADDPQWKPQGGPYRLSDLSRAHGRGRKG